MPSTITYKGVLDAIFHELAPHLEHKDKLALRLTCRALCTAVDTRDCGFTGAWLKLNTPRPDPLAPRVPVLVPFDGARPSLMPHSELPAHIEMTSHHMRNLRKLYISGQPASLADLATLLDPAKLPHLEEVELWPIKCPDGDHDGYLTDISALFPEDAGHATPALSIRCGAGALLGTSITTHKCTTRKRIRIPAAVQSITFKYMAFPDIMHVDFVHPHVKIVFEEPNEEEVTRRQLYDHYVNIHSHGLISEGMESICFHWLLRTLTKVFKACADGDVPVQVIGVGNAFYPPDDRWEHIDIAFAFAWMVVPQYIDLEVIGPQAYMDALLPRPVAGILSDPDEDTDAAFGDGAEAAADAAPSDDV
ncbi:hypothetical protein Q8F55_008653 [Vanrija albida]|uniref:F-box domain-containing protein n=1 Tax=Vanrija albida TaxID=181172 RepID=A0ABR3PRE4_9TREE